MTSEYLAYLSYFPVTNTILLNVNLGKSNGQICNSQVKQSAFIDCWGSEFELLLL